MSAMQIATLDNAARTKLAYVDSGPVDGGTYATIVCIHGVTFNASKAPILFFFISLIETLSRKLRSPPDCRA